MSGPEPGMKLVELINTDGAVTRSVALLTKPVTPDASDDNALVAVVVAPLISDDAVGTE